MMPAEANPLLDPSGEVGAEGEDEGKGQSGKEGRGQDPDASTDGEEEVRILICICIRIRIHIRIEHGFSNIIGVQLECDRTRILRRMAHPPLPPPVFKHSSGTLVNDNFTCHQDLEAEDDPFSDMEALTSK